MIKVNEIVFSKDRYNDSREKMYEAVMKQLMLLMENEYTCKIYDDDIDTIVIQYEHNNRRDYWGTPDLCWLTQEQVELLEAHTPSEAFTVSLFGKVDPATQSADYVDEIRIGDLNKSWSDFYSDTGLTCDGINTDKVKLTVLG